VERHKGAIAALVRLRGVETTGASTLRKNVLGVTEYPVEAREVLIFGDYTTSVPIIMDSYVSEIPWALR
jgi:hypothetical protein